MAERIIFTGRGKTFGMDVLIQGVSGKNFLEMMAGANRWHQRARFVFAQQNSLDLDKLEANLHEGKQIVEEGRENKVSGFGKLALDVYREYQQRVEEIGNGDVSEYAKKASGLSRQEIDLQMQEYFKKHRTNLKPTTII